MIADLLPYTDPTVICASPGTHGCVRSRNPRIRFKVRYFPFPLSSDLIFVVYTLLVRRCSRTRHSAPRRAPHRAVLACRAR